MGELARPRVWLAAVLTAFVATALAADEPAAGPTWPRAIGEQCVAPTDVMRRDHMDLLNHQRDETVLDGQRANPYSLVGCVNCHASRDATGAAIRIDADGQFCQSCHAYAAVRIDCFSCHSALPEDKEVVGLKQPLTPKALAALRETRLLQAYAHGN